MQSNDAVAAKVVVHCHVQQSSKVWALAMEATQQTISNSEIPFSVRVSGPSKSTHGSHDLQTRKVRTILLKFDDLLS